jgi:hypothetical protein
MAVVRGTGGRSWPGDLGGGHAARQKAHRGAFDIALDTGDLAGEADMGLGAQAHLLIQQRGRVDEGVAVDAAEPREGGVLQPGNHPENIRLRAVLHLGLEADDVVERAELVVAAQLHDGVGLFTRIVRVGQAHGLHRAMAQRLAPAFGHHLDGQAAVEIAGRFPGLELGLLGGEQRVDEGLVLVPRHRAVDIGGALLLRLALVVAGLLPRHGHVDRVGIDDGRDGVEEGEAVLPVSRAMASASAPEVSGPVATIQVHRWEVP